MSVYNTEGFSNSDKSYEHMRSQLENVFVEFKDVVATDMHDQGKAIDTKRRMETKGDPVSTPARELAHSWKPILDKTIKELLEHDIIQIKRLLWSNRDNANSIECPSA